MTAAPQLVSATEGAFDFHAIGLDHRASGARLRDLVFIETASLPEVLGWLREAGLPAAVLLSTCDRVEAIVRHPSAEAARAAFAAALARTGRVPAAEIASELRPRSGAEAVRRLFAIAAALESQVLGEPQVLGQVKEAHAIAAATGASGPELDALFAAAFAAAKRVRSETGLALRPISMAEFALRVARDILGVVAR